MNRKRGGLPAHRRNPTLGELRAVPLRAPDSSRRRCSRRRSPVLPPRCLSPNADCSPLRKSVAAFAAEEVLVGSRQPVWGPPSASGGSSPRGSGDSASGGSSSLRGSGDSGDRIPAHRSTTASSSSGSEGPKPAAAPQGSAWNPWQGELTSIVSPLIGSWQTPDWQP